MKRFAPALVALVLLAAAPAWGQTFRPGGPTADGTRAVCDIDKGQHIRNVGGSDGAGLCVFTSAELASRWQGSTLDGFQRWMSRRPGGGWPEKLDQELTRFCREQRRPIPDYIQHTGGDEEFLDLAVKTGRVPCVTYAGRDDFYSSRIAHMVNLAHLDSERAAIIDNNRPGVWVWMSRKDFLSRWRDMNGGWAFVLLDPPPPPYPSEPRQAVGQCAGGQCPTGGSWVWVDGYGWAWATPTTPAAPAKAEPKADPKPEPKAEPKPEPKIENHGIDTDKVHSGKKWYLNGSECDKGEAMRAVGGSGLVDDSDRWFLVCVGSEVERSKFLDLVKQLDATTRARLHVRDYAASDWAVSQFELPRGVSVRKAARGRVGTEAGRFAGELDAGTLGRFVADCFSPPPAPMPAPPPAPAPTPPSPANPEPAPAPTPPNPTLDLPTWLVIAFAAVVAFILGSRRNR